MHMLMRQDMLRMSVLVAWGVEVVHFQIASFLVLVDTKVKVRLCEYFLVLTGSKLFRFELILELQLLAFFLNDLVNSFLDLSQML